MIGLGSDKNDNARIGDWRQIDYWYLGEKVSWEIKGEGAAFIQVVLKVDYISDSTTNVGRALKMESVMSSFRLFMATSIGARQPQSVQGNLNLCRATSICAKQPQSVQNNLNSCKTTSIRAEKKKQKVTAYFRGIKWIYELKLLALARAHIEIRHFAKNLGEKCQEQPQQWPKQSAPPI